MLSLITCRVYQFVCDAENLSTILGDREYSKHLANLRRSLESAVDDTNRNKDLLNVSRERV
jgi:hypothetical protein